MEERVKIETIKEFRIRHEDFYFAIGLLIWGFILNVFLISILPQSTGFTAPIIITLIVFNLLIIGGVIFNGW